MIPVVLFACLFCGTVDDRDLPLVRIVPPESRRTVDLPKWIAAVRSAGRTGPRRLASVIARVDPKFDERTAIPQMEELGVRGRAPFVAADLFWGHMDEDSALEAVVVVRHHGEFINGMSREEGYWIGIFDRRGNKMQLVATIQYVLDHCNWHDLPLAVVVGFTSARHGPRAALWVIRQRTEGCGTLIAYDYYKVEVRTARKGVRVRKVPGPPPVSYQRGTSD